MTLQSCILITRPQPDASDFAIELEAQGFKTLAEPMLEIVPQDLRVPDLNAYQGLVFTSANAVRVCSSVPELCDMPVYTVGGYTAKAVAEKDFTNITASEGGGQDLAEFLIGHIQDKSLPLLHLRGQDVAFDLKSALAEGSIGLDELTVYEARPVNILSPEIVDSIRNKEIAAVTFFSKRTAENFIALARQAGVLEELSHIKALCISEAVLKYVRIFSWAETYVAEKPHRSGMLALLRHVCA